MLLTPRAEALAPALSRTLGELEALMLDRPSFEPALARQRFTLCTVDFIEALLLPGLVAELARHAPGVDLVVARPDSDFERSLEDGSADLVIGMRRDRVAAVVWRKLFREDFVCMLRRGHPAARGRFTLERFLELGHVMVSTGVSGSSAVDLAVARIKKARRVALSIPTFLMAPYVVASSDLVATHPARLARRAAETLPLELRSPPLRLPGFDIHLGWHERRRQDAAHAWLRDVVAKVARDATEC
jgi:DNA-binding transcriptional LysR family regulator